MGSKCLTDGNWVWPEGLAHYIEAHEVRLPDEFVDGMQKNSWRVPVTKGWPTFNTQGEPDYAFWIAWAQAAVKGRPSPA